MMERETLLAEYDAVRGGAAGLIDFSAHGRLRLAGAEVVAFLNGLITNDVKALAAETWMPAIFPNVQGRLIAVVRILRTGDEFIVDTDAPTAARVRANLERFTLAGDFRVRDVTDETALISVQGVQAARIVARALGADDDTENNIINLARQVVLTTSWRDATLHIIRATHTAEDGYDIFAPAQKTASSLREALTAAGAVMIEAETLELLRIEAGVPRYGVDIDDHTIALETALDDAISFTKGCYLGQEIIARIHWRGHVARRLTGIVFDDAADHDRVKGGDKIISADGKDIGRLTSTVFSPHLARRIGLAMLKYDYLSAGTEVKMAADDGAELYARVVALPFVRGSWHGATMGTAIVGEKAKDA